MNSTPSLKLSSVTIFLTQYSFVFRALFAGCLMPLSFAPFHFPGLAILGIGLLFSILLQPQTGPQAAWRGFFFGIGYMGIGVSWVFVSIHLYGHLNTFLSALITCVFIVYLAVFFAIFSFVFVKLKAKVNFFTQGLLFAALWCLTEYFRASCFGGFPWLQLGFGQIDTPLAYTLSVIGLYGVGFWTCLAAVSLTWAVQHQRLKLSWLLVFIALMLGPTLLRYVSWTKSHTKPISVGVIQANLSMRDKWDEHLFWNILEHYQQRIEQLIGQKQVVILPESAIPMPASYLGDWLGDLHNRAQKEHTALLMGIPKPTSRAETYYYNTLSSFGQSEGAYLKQHLVPFGEYTPKPFQQLMTWLHIPETSMKPGKANQSPIMVQNHPIAALICYELAYPELLRQQLPQAEWIVSVSDDGWFGHSLAMYQQVQMAQALAIQTGRYHIIANNDGLSSIIDTQGKIITTLPAFNSGVLEGIIYATQGQTPWVRWGDKPILAMSWLIVLIALCSKRRYP